MSAELIERLERISKEITGGGISWSMGGDYRRYDSETGKPHIYTRPAELTTSSRKLRAIIDLYESLPAIIEALAAPREPARREDER